MTSFLTDTTFDEFNTSTLIGRINDHNLWIQKKQCCRRLKSHYEILLYLQDEYENISYFPVVRYGIDNDPKNLIICI